MKTLFRILTPLLAWLVYVYVWLLKRTCRWTLIHQHVLRDKPTAPYIFAFWHGRLLLMPEFNPKHSPTYVMISRHGDGKFISRVIRYFDLHTIEGSTNRLKQGDKGAKNRGGSAALKQALDQLNAGNSVAITPDGPKGPNRKVRGNIITIASKTGATIFPCSYASRPAIRVKSWDQFLLPFIFGSGTFIAGKPMHIAKNISEAEEEILALELENELNRITDIADNNLSKPPILKRLYTLATILGAPLIDGFLHIRKWKGKEHKERYKERLGYASHMRPSGKLLWLHAASVGEVLSALPLLSSLSERFSNYHFLLTTGTTTSAELVSEKLPPRVIHQFVPIDRFHSVRRFMNHWQPDVALWLESELWPNMMEALRSYHVKSALINARISERSFLFWQKHPEMARFMLEGFSVCLAQTEQDRERLQNLGAPHISVIGNLKLDVPALSADHESLTTLQNILGNRPLWLAASTHPGEEEQVWNVHQRLQKDFPSLLTILVPRHAIRGEEIKKMLTVKGAHISMRSQKELPDSSTQIYLADSMGELGVFFRLADIVFMGGSLVCHGGQNPLEPARLASAIISGAHVHNFKNIYDEMTAKKAVTIVNNADALASEIDELLSNPTKRRSYITAALDYAASHSGIKERYISTLGPLLQGTR